MTQLYMCGGLVTKSYPTLATPWTVACQAPLSMGFSMQEYWSGLPFLSLGDLLNAGIKSRSPALQADSLPRTPGKPQLYTYIHTYIHSFLNILFHYGLSQEIGYSFLCQTVGFAVYPFSVQ